MILYAATHASVVTSQNKSASVLSKKGELKASVLHIAGINSTEQKQTMLHTKYKVTQTYKLK